MKQITPAPDGSEATSEIIKQLYPEAKRQDQVALFGQEEKIEQYLSLNAKLKELERERDKLKQELQLAMGDAEIGQAQGYVIKWKNQVRQTLDTQRLKKELAEVYSSYLKPDQIIRVFKVQEV